MISISLAKNLREAGLVWKAGVNDFFAVPDRGMDDRVFVISDLLANLDILSGWPVVTFHGTAEWALDYILTAEVLWLPREEQLRQTILAAVRHETIESLRLSFDGRYYQCSLHLDSNAFHSSAPSASAAYGQVLLQILQKRANEEDRS